MHWNVGNSTPKRTNIGKSYSVALFFFKFCTKWASGETVMEFQYCTYTIFLGT